MSAALLIGHAAARTLHNRAVRDLPPATDLMLPGAVVPWLACGLMVRDWPLIVANIVSTLCVGMLVTARLLWRDRA